MPAPASAPAASSSRAAVRQDAPDTVLASIVVTVKHWHKIGGSQTFSESKISLPSTAPSWITQDPNTGVVTVDKTTLPAGTVIQLQFDVVDTNNKSTTYWPVGIAFKPDSGKPSDPEGLKAFPSRTISDENGTSTKLVVTDEVSANTTYDFGVVIQTTDGTLSVVDPMLTNKSS